MIAARPSLAQVRAQVVAIRERAPNARVVGIRFPGPWDGPAQLSLSGETADIARSDSVLEIRALLTARPDDAPVLVVLTNLGEAELGGDVVARLARRRVFPFNLWDIVRDRFKARDVDPALASQGWIAEALIEQMPSEGYPPVASGVLDGETVWQILLDGMGLRSPVPDAVELLCWTMDHANLERYRASAAEFRAGFREWIGRRAPGVALALLDCVEASSGADALPLGLVCRVVFDPGGQEEGALREAAARLERCWGDRRLEPAIGQAWAAAAKHVVTDLIAREGTRAARPWLERADAILEGVGAQAFAHLSTLSPVGFEQRLARYGRLLLAALDERADRLSAELLRAAASVQEHARATWEPVRSERVEMSVRLLTWLRRRQVGGVPPPRSFEETLDTYALDGAFVDWMRGTLRGAESPDVVSEAYARLVSGVGDHREQDNQRFGALLAEWSTAGSASRGALPIENVLATTVTGLARSRPVLLLVVDGMSVAVGRELLEDIAEYGWVLLAPPGEDRLPSVIAALPTVTEVSRASLLCGRITSGTSADEKEGFARNPSLLGVSKAKSPPILFHKAGLTEGGADLADAVREAVSSPERRVVGVVLNAVDDQLLKADQVRPRWTVEYIRLLAPLLSCARSGGRIVVLTSDHGHVLDSETRLERFDQGDRWRVDDGAPRPDEVVLAGPRVVARSGSRIIAPWSERTRYGNRKNGYHGGATPQEVVVPLFVLAPLDVEVEGWAEASMGYPPWWDLADDTPPAAPVRPPKRTVPPVGRTLTFEFPAGPAAPAAAARWLDALFGSPVYAAQRRLAGRVAPPDARVRLVLETLDQRGGKLTRAALAHKLDQPHVRVNGLIAAMRRLLNVEGYPILSVDEPSDTVELNRELLRVQFGF